MRTIIVQHAGHAYYLSRKDWDFGISIEPDEKTEIQNTWFATITAGSISVGDKTGKWTPSPRPKATGIIIILGSHLDHIPTVRLSPNYTIRNKVLTKKHQWNQGKYMGTIQIWELIGILDLEEI